MQAKFLGIENSCDDTSICIYDRKTGILNQVTYTQKLHNRFGGTVPKLSSVFHNKNIPKILILTLKKCNIKINDITFLSYAIEPGLINSLRIGTFFSKSLASFTAIPSIGISHIEAHLLINYLFYRINRYPILSILVSGGHTMLLIMKSYNKIKIIGNTLDDSIGESFDKVCRFLKIRIISGYQIYKLSKNKFRFLNLILPKPIIKKNCNDFSFSGLKTHILKNYITNKTLSKNFKSNLSYNFQNTVIKIISYKCIRILNSNKINGILLSGGVSANLEFRLEIRNISESFALNVYAPPVKYCTDNGSMIAFLGFIKVMENNIDMTTISKCRPKNSILP